MNNLVAFAGFAQSGKDTAARCLIERGYTRLAFADELKEMALNIDPSIYCPNYTEDYYGHYCGLSSLVSDWGWERAKADADGDVRQFLQRLGQSIRELDEDFWVRQVEKQILATADNKQCISPGGATYYRTVPKPTVITDVRYPNEAEWVTRGRQPANYMGPPPAWVPDGLLIWVDRPGVGPVNGHESENPAIRDMCDVVIVNDGTVDELWEKVLEVVDAE